MWRMPLRWTKPVKFVTNTGNYQNIRSLIPGYLRFLSNQRTSICSQIINLKVILILEGYRAEWETQPKRSWSSALYFKKAFKSSHLSGRSTIGASAKEKNSQSHQLHTEVMRADWWPIPTMDIIWLITTWLKTPSGHWQEELPVYLVALGNTTCCYVLFFLSYL